MRVSVPGRRMTCDGDGPTSVEWRGLPVARSTAVTLLENHWLWNRVFWSRLTAMLCGLLRFSDGRNIFRSISHVEVSKLVMEPGLVLPADFSNWVSTSTSPTPWTSGLVGGFSVAGSLYFSW